MENGRSPAFRPVVVGIFPARPDEDIVAEERRRRSEERERQFLRVVARSLFSSTYTSLQLLRNQKKILNGEFR